VSQAHVMADTESLGEAGLRFLEGLAAAPETERRVRVPTLTDPRGLDFAVYKRLGQTEAMAALEARAIAALKAFGVLMTDTCINYQTILPPTRGDHLAYGDTGVVIYSNSVFGARSNFATGPRSRPARPAGRADARRAGRPEAGAPVRSAGPSSTPSSPPMARPAASSMSSSSPHRICHWSRWWQAPTRCPAAMYIARRRC